MKGKGDTTITRADIEAKLRAIRDNVDPMGEQAKGGLKAALPVIAVGIIVLAYVTGLKRGKKRRAVIEIRRI